MKSGHIIWLFLVNITTHLNDLNSRLQIKEQLVNDLYEFIKSFQNKHKLWKNQILNKNLYHFPTLATYSVVDFKSFPEELQYLNSQFPKRCEDFRKQEVNLDIFSSPFSVDVKKVPLFL